MSERASSNPAFQLASEKTAKALRECIFLTQQGLIKFGTHEELARRMCHGRDNALLASRLQKLASEQPSTISLAPLLTLKEQLIAVLK